MDVNWHVHIAPTDEWPPLLRQRGPVVQPADEFPSVYLTEMRVRDYVDRKGDTLFNGTQKSLDDIRY